MMIRPIIAAVLAVSFTFVNPCSQESKVKKPKVDDTVYDVTVIYPKFISVPKKYHVPGTLEASELDVVTANADGELDQVYVTAGDKVVKDDPLVSIANNTLLEQIDIKRARIKEYQARLTDVQAQLDISGGEDRPVAVEDTQFLDEDPVEDEPVMKKFGDANEPVQTPKSLKTLMEVLEKAIDVFQKEADVLDRRLLELNQNSPVEGMVTDVFVTEGNKVKQGAKLIEVAQTNPMSIKFYLPEETASYIDKNSSVTVTPEGEKDVKGEGTVYFISPNIDTNSGKIEVRAHVSNEKGLLKGSQKANVYVSTRKMGRVVVLPKRLLVYDKDKTFVYVAFRGQAKLTEVTLGDELEGGNIQIHGDLRVDDPIIIDRPQDLKHDSFVKITEQGPAIKETTEETE